LRKESNFIERKGIASLEWSPCDSYIIGCEKKNPNSMENNLFIWETQTGTLVNSFDWNNKA
jgi:hypothetical protein